VKVPTLGISGIPLGSLRTNWHLVIGPMARHRVYYMGKVAVSPKSELWWVLWVRVCPWLICAPKCFNSTLTNLLFGLCMLVWLIELLINLPSPILELQHAPLPLKCYEPGYAPQFFFLSLSAPLDSHLSPSRSFTTRNLVICNQSLCNWHATNCHLQLSWSCLQLQIWYCIFFGPYGCVCN